MLGPHQERIAPQGSEEGEGPGEAEVRPHPVPGPAPAHDLAHGVDQLIDVRSPGETAGGFAETVENIELVGSRVVDHIVANWPQWKGGVPAQ